MLEFREAERRARTLLLGSPNGVADPQSKETHLIIRVREAILKANREGYDEGYSSGLMQPL